MSISPIAKKEQQQTRDEIGQGSETFPKIKIRRENLFVKERARRVGTKDYSSAAPNVFILGNSTHGILGTSKLGDTSGVELVISEIKQDNDEYKEYFDNTEFLSGASTATIDTVNFRVDF